MHPTSCMLHSAIRAFWGEPILEREIRALHGLWLLPALALAPDADPITRAIAALAHELDALLTPSIVCDPALQNAVVRSIGMESVFLSLSSCARIAPGRWGTAHAAELIKAAQQRKCRAGDVAALIGPCERAARLLVRSSDISVALCLWGQSTPENPTAWMDAISANDRDRLIDTVRLDPNAVPRCLPWLPSNIADQMQIVAGHLAEAINAFAIASPCARARHASLVGRLVGQAQPEDLNALTRLACVMESDDVWRRIVTLVQESPDDAWRVVAATPWDDLDATVRAVILERADQSDMCAAVAAAQGRSVVRRISRNSAFAFFAALDPKVWDALPSNEQRQWRDALPEHAAHLAVRSLGLRPDILAKAEMGNNLVRAAQRHARDDGELRWALFPAELRSMHSDMSYALFTALPTPPPDPGAFFAIASGQRDRDRLTRIRTTVRTENDLKIVFALQRSATSGETVLARCAALQDALHGRTWNDLAQFMPILDAEDRDVLTPDLDAPVQRLARSDRRTEMRQALERLASLPLEVAVPVFIALNQQEPRYALSVAEVIASALHAHGDLFVTIVDTMKDGALRNALLPLPDDTALADALRDVARDDPLSAHRLAHALRGRTWIDAIHALLTAQPHHANTVWQALNDAVRNRIVASIAATPSGIDPITARDPIAALALAAAQANDDDLRDAGIAALASRPAWVRVIWEQLPQEVQQRLCAYLEFADLRKTSERPADRRISRR